MLGLVMLTWTIRCTPARLAAWKRDRELATAASWSICGGEAHPVGVVERGCPRSDSTRPSWSSKSSGRTSMRPAGARSGCPVSVRTWRPDSHRRPRDGPPRVAEGAGDDVEPGVADRSSAAADAMVAVGVSVAHGGPFVGRLVPTFRRLGKLLGMRKQTQSPARSPSRWLSISSPR